MPEQAIGPDGELWDVIHTYTRRQAIADGALVDVSETAREAGIRFPCAVTIGVWCDYVRVPEGVVCQDEAGRLWDVLWMLRHAIRRAAPGSDLIYYTVRVRNDNRRPQVVRLKAVCGPGDDGEPVITVMLPEED